MANLRTIRKRISSVKSTQQITKAMKMVSAAKLRRAQEAINAARPYAKKLREVVQSIAAQAGPEAHPLLAQRAPKVLAILVITSDRGLCGGFNSNLLRATQRFIAEQAPRYERIDLYVVGRRARDFFKRRKFEMSKEYIGVLSKLSFIDAEQIARDLVGAYLDGTFDELVVGFNEFRSAISQTPRFEKMFPIVLDAGKESAASTVDYLYEPGQEAILATLLPKYVETTIFRYLLESLAGEHGARMASMDSATNNSREMISSLTLTMNRARQATITKELMEIIGGAEALKG